MKYLFLLYFGTLSAWLSAQTPQDSIYRGGGGDGYASLIIDNPSDCFISTSQTYEGDGAAASIFANPNTCPMHNSTSGSDGFAMSGTSPLCPMHTATSGSDGFATAGTPPICPMHTTTSGNDGFAMAGTPPICIMHSTLSGGDGYAREGMLEDYCALIKRQLQTTACNTVDNGTFCNKFTDAQVGEPSGMAWAADGIQNTLWFEFFPPSSGVFSIETINSTFDTELAVYAADLATGCPDCQLASAESGGIGNNAKLTLSCLAPSRKYYLQLDGRNGEVGSTDIRISDICPTPATAGADECGNAPIVPHGAYNFCVSPNSAGITDPSPANMALVAGSSSTVCGQSVDVNLDNSTFFPIMWDQSELHIDVTLNQSMCGQGFSVMVFQPSSGNCPIPDQWGNIDNPLVACFEGNGLGNVGNLTGIVPNTIYYILIDGVNQDIGLIQLYFSSKLLPLTWLQFTGERRDNKHWLFWKTGTEEGVSHFEVERSNNGLQFAKIGNVTAVGNSQTPQSYTFVDEAPMQGFNYYRIQQVAQDLSTQYSNIIVLENNASFENAFSVYPNPALDECFVQCNTSLETTVFIELYDLLGRQLIRRRMDTPQNARQQLLIGHLAAGVYCIKVKNLQDQTLYQTKLVKQTN